MRMSSSIRWRSGETVADGTGVETFMILLLSVTEADCLDRQHRRVTGATNQRQRRRSGYRGSGLVLCLEQERVRRRTCKIPNRQFKKLPRGRWTTGAVAMGVRLRGVDRAVASSGRARCPPSR